VSRAAHQAPAPIPFDLACRRCPRLAAHLDAVRQEHPAYHARPVPPFGDPAARLLVVGLAPGLHGANASGRPFTGDHAGIILYATLHRFGYASRSESLATDDGLELRDCRITNAVKCLPPQNKPTGPEVRDCNGYLAAEVATLPAGAVILALGRIAHDAVLAAVAARRGAHPFAHAASHDLGRCRLVDSYHCSRYNTNTRRLTPAMFDAVFERIGQLLG